MKKVIWAIDPFERETRPDPGAAQQFIDWMTSGGYAVQPVYVLGVSNIDPDEIDEGRWLERSAPSAEKAANQYIADLGIRGALAAKVPIYPAHSRGGFVQRLLSFADEENAELIALSSHGRSGLGRITLGSFAETVLLHSRKPVLFLTRSVRQSPSAVRRILFPTDLSRSARAALRLLLPQARVWQAEVILFHSVALPPYAIGGAGLTGAADASIPEDFFETQTAWANQELDQWVQEAQDWGVRCRKIVNQEGISSHVGLSILSAAEREEVQLVAMASKSKAFTSFVAGSVAREVFRTRQFPVWVCGPQALADLLESQAPKTAV